MSVRLKIILGIFALVMLNFFLIIVFTDNGLVELGRLKKAIKTVEKKNEKLLEENQELYRIIRRLKNDSDYIESVARKELGMIGRDELIFKLRNRPEESANE